MKNVKVNASKLMQMAVYMAAWPTQHNNYIHTYIYTLWVGGGGVGVRSVSISHQNQKHRPHQQENLLGVSMSSC